MIYLCSYVGDGTVGNAVIRAWTGRKESHSELLLGDTTFASTIRDGGVRSQSSRKTLAKLEHWVIEPCKWITPDQLIAHFAATQGQTYDWIGLVGWLARKSLTVASTTKALRSARSGSLKPGAFRTRNSTTPERCAT